MQATSAAEACRDAIGLRVDKSDCSLATLLASWSGSGHEERSFERPGPKLDGLLSFNAHHLSMREVRSVTCQKTYHLYK